MKQIYVVCSCDAWKSHDSEKTLMVTTSVRKLKSFIAKKIRDDTFDYYLSEWSKKKQEEKFKRDFDIIPREQINNYLIYGMLDYYYDGEEIQEVFMGYESRIYVVDRYELKKECRGEVIACYNYEY